jgi:REP-associated tyrosine transposase
MSRARRDLAAGLFHVYSHSVWAAELYRDDRDRLVFLREIARAVDKAQWLCLGFCLLGTHYHLLLDVDEDALPVGMHSLNFRHAMAFNARHRMKGHVLGARYDSVRIRDDDQLLAAFRYVMRNPVEAGLVERPEDWPWSSYAATIGLAEQHSFVNPSRILGSFGGPPELAAASLRDFVTEL